MLPIFFVPGQQIKKFTVYDKDVTRDAKKRVIEARDDAPIETFKGTISAASQREREQWKQAGHPISHTIVVRGRTRAKAESIISLKDRYFTVQGKTDPSEVGIFTILYCEERAGVFSHG